MKRVPNTYITINLNKRQEEQTLEPVKDEVSKFLSGECLELSAQGEADLRATLSIHDARAKIFMAAYGQKSIRRLARLMEAIECVDNEVMAPWRIKSLDSKDLIALMAELNNEQARAVKDIGAIHDMKINADVELNRIVPRAKASIVSTLSPEAKGRVLKFMDERVLDATVQEDNS